LTNSAHKKDWQTVLGSFRQYLATFGHFLVCPFCIFEEFLSVWPGLIL